MSWFSSGADCVGDKRWKCYYEIYNDPYHGPSTTRWCRDYEEGCPQYDSGGQLVDWVDQRPPPPPPGQTKGGWL